jgi:hypothetical protein
MSSNMHHRQNCHQPTYDHALEWSGKENSIDQCYHVFLSTIRFKRKQPFHHQFQENIHGASPIGSGIFNHYHHRPYILLPKKGILLQCNKEMYAKE